MEEQEAAVRDEVKIVILGGKENEEEEAINISGQ